MHGCEARIMLSYLGFLIIGTKNLISWEHLVIAFFEILGNLHANDNTTAFPKGHDNYYKLHKIIPSHVAPRWIFDFYRYLIIRQYC